MEQALIDYLARYGPPVLFFAQVFGIFGLPIPDELLMTVAETMTQRERLKRDVKSLTAEGRVSAYVLAILPVALGFAMWALNPDYMNALFDETIGKAMLVGGLLLMIAGFVWMQAIVKIDV